MSGEENITIVIVVIKVIMVTMVMGWGVMGWVIGWGARCMGCTS